MKTMKLFAVLSLVLMIGIANAHSSKVPKANNNFAMGPAIRYQVNIHLQGEQSGCNVYWVLITDLRGNNIAAPKVYNPSVATYNFYELGTVRGVRIARIVLGPSLGGFACDANLYTEPAIMMGDFMGGETYVFDLFPTNVPVSKD
jgi:hypothetical protein